MKNFSANKFIFVLLLAAMAALATSCSSSNANNQANNTNTNVNSAAVTAAAQPGGAAVPQVAPEALVADLYKQHDAEKSPFFQSKDRALVDKYFAKTLADLIWKDATRSDQENEMGALDADPLYNAQDTEIKNFKVGAANIKGDKADVPVTFENFGKKQTIKFSLVMEKGSWKIADINYGEAGTLVKWLKDSTGPEKTAAGDARFEGKYQVGDTTCTVKPIKMAFEVKWAKGTGSEIFIYDDRSGDRVVYKSESSKGAEPNIFSFDDDTLDTGTFYRSDGKEFPVKRVF